MIIYTLLKNKLIDKIRDFHKNILYSVSALNLDVNLLHLYYKSNNTFLKI